MTSYYLDKYASLIVRNFLSLQKDDLLSLNTEERDIDFARIVANKALEITENVVKVVVTENGKVQDVVEFEPSAVYSQGKGFAMLHIAHCDKKVVEEGKLLDTVVDKDDFPSLQKLGHLADPQIPGRRISVPFCVVPVYDNGDPREDNIISIIDSDVDSAVLACTYRSQFLRHADLHKFEVSGSDCRFVFEVPEDSLFPCGSITLSNGRKYVSSIDFDKTIIPVCKDSLCGNFNASFDVFGRHFEGEFVFENGVLVSYPESAELKRLFEYDSNIMKPGFIKAGDKSFEIFLGGGCVDTIDYSLSELPPYFNECPYCLKLVIPDNLNAFFTSCDGKTTEIIRKGFFLE